jgi:PTS system fructose-specific IIC component
VRKPEECPVREPRIVIGVSRGGVDFNSLDGQSTHLICLVCADQVLLHLKIIAELILLFRAPDLVDSIRSASDPQAVLDLLLHRSAAASPLN